MSKLKPCPFCGGEATIQPEGDYHEIHCEDCGIELNRRTYDETVTAWNTRAETEAEKKIRKICEYYDSKSSDTDNLGLIGKMCVAREILEILEGER